MTPVIAPEVNMPQSNHFMALPTPPSADASRSKQANFD
jgi:hypothetical protein